MQKYPLNEGEVLLWSGSPQRRQKWFPEHTALVLSVVVFPAIVALQLIVFDDSTAAPMLGGLLIAFFCVAYQRLLDRRSRAGVTTYLVTNQRIVFAANWLNGSEFRWVWLTWLPSEPRVRADDTGVGTIVFGSRWSRARVRENELRGAWAPPALELHQVADAQRVADLILNARAQLVAA
ncbi:hypothetical protein [Amycolatopsis regifaucium]|uniref:DUF304 domain-containing protein n=1 Tax=Amycolatopsis regifaucium TaxID=546365 RepID=A0A154MNV2_9PSEU|nr:hypothetical protein [Amycolatopsis regifaucium]KZB85945.1 hypothetical protein AVL48_27430 [Amycolatopsis regifaucium]OKA04835.1 hypothetical protein ATP06_0227485 [Amycolatopsis regifaucium]SFH72375.1 hypothetical protein SAMN04489731_10656 [Amycolatopsis regifaucium]